MEEADSANFVNFGGAEFEGSVTFEKAKFRSAVIKDGGSFYYSAFFGNTSFNQFANFNDIRTLNGASFSTAKFYGGASFSQAVFHGPDIENVTDLNFDNLDFSKSTGRVSFSNSVFCNSMSMMNIVAPKSGQLRFTAAVFLGDVDFSNGTFVRSNADDNEWGTRFSQTYFAGKSLFQEDRFGVGGTAFDDDTFMGVADFSNSSVGQIDGLSPQHQDETLLNFGWYDSTDTSKNQPDSFANGLVLNGLDITAGCVDLSAVSISSIAYGDKVTISGHSGLWLPCEQDVWVNAPVNGQTLTSLVSAHCR